MTTRKGGDDHDGKANAGETPARSHASGRKRAHLATVRDASPGARGDRASRPRRAHGQCGPVGGWPKRAFDVFGATLALCFFAPFLVSIAIVVRLDSAGASIIRRPRVGLGGTIIRVWAFRCTSGTQTDRESPPGGEGRPTRVGEVLMRTGWDVWPGLVNVLIGEMSFVGPQPHAPDDDASFAAADPCYVLRRLARPGLTGWAQVNDCVTLAEGGGDVRVLARHDVEYARSWSLGRDIRILTKLLTG